MSCHKNNIGGQFRSQFAVFRSERILENFTQASDKSARSKPSPEFTSRQPAVAARAAREPLLTLWDNHLKQSRSSDSPRNTAETPVQSIR